MSKKCIFYCWAGWTNGGAEGEKSARIEFQERQAKKEKDSMQYFREWKQKIKAERESAAREVCFEFVD
jgi:hypothetical protein